MKIKRILARARRKQVDLVVFPELAITGYPPQDLLLENSFVQKNQQLLEKLIAHNRGVAGVVGFVDCKGKNRYNAAAVFVGNQKVGVVHKALLPTYDVFDEDRYFKRARERDIKPVLVTLGGRKVRLGVEICEDLWDKEYSLKVTDLLVRRGADIIINISASPFHVGKQFERLKVLREKARRNHVPIVYANLVGGQDELVFDGQSLAVDSSGCLIAVGKQFEEDLVIIDLKEAPKAKLPPYRREREMFGALVLGIRDYFGKTGFRRAVVGLSGGIDSSLTSCIAVQSLGKANVIGVSMPSEFSSEHSKADAQKLAENLGIRLVQFSIQDIVNAYRRTLNEPLEAIRRSFGIAKEADDPVADENIQPRARGNCLMDFSNRLKDLKILVVTTGNKTEMALGYCTLYGDMAGGVNALGDVNKLDVYRLAMYVNEQEKMAVIPKAVFTKMPSPELRPGQFDPFDFNVVSPLVDEIVENQRSKEELVKMGYPKQVVEDICWRIRNAEYKRRQAAPCIKITPKAFGIGRRMPIVNQYRN
jgi:NAD+ synthase (glutamine-hydrolysing)